MATKVAAGRTERADGESSLVWESRRPPSRRGGKRADLLPGKKCRHALGAVGLLIGFGFAARGAEAAAAAPKPWHSAVKDIEVGPGKLDFGLNVRSRYEHLDNFNILHYGAAEDDDVLLLRTRLSADYRLSAQAHTFVEFQDARYWLSKLTLEDFGRSSSYYDEFDLRQAYFEWQRIGASPLGVKLGRQIMSYGDRRVFAPAEWGNVGNYWWDGAKLCYDTDAIQVDAFYAQRVLSEPKDWNLDHWPYHVAAIYARLRRLPVALDGFYVLKHDWSGNLHGETGTGNETRHTFGLLSERPAGQGWDYGCFAAGQLGEYGRDAIRAFGVIGRGGYTFPAAWKPRVGLEVNYASGDHDPDDGVAGTFDGIFGAMDLPYGWMNVVSWKNLEDYALTVSVQPAKPLRLGVEYHGFRLAQARDAWYWVNGRPERRDATGHAGQELGQEVDVIGRWQVNKGIELLVGYARFFAGAFVRSTPGDSQDANWAFAQLTYTF
ncbi:MAG: alginate export family protein [Verrucomicrobia bacterium]|nr:alginate export family protein [Verrucomicrobiota bacterium]